MSKLSRDVNLSFSLVAILWVVFLVDLILPADLRVLGLRPRSIDGLFGIALMPFLHGNLRHLMANTGALFVLLLVGFSFSRKITFKALMIIWILGGLLVWLFARGNTVHIGASGIIFGLVGYLMMVGFFRRELIALVFSLLVFFLYGGSLITLFIHIPGVSWTGHFFGFLSGITAAWSTKTGKTA